MPASASIPVGEGSLNLSQTASTKQHLHDETNWHANISLANLVYLNWQRSGVARWEEIDRINLQRGDESPTRLTVYLNDGTRIRFPDWPSRGSADLYTLKKYIEERMISGDLRVRGR